MSERASEHVIVESCVSLSTTVALRAPSRVSTSEASESPRVERVRAQRRAQHRTISSGPTRTENFVSPASFRSEITDETYAASPDESFSPIMLGTVRRKRSVSSSIAVLQHDGMLYRKRGRGPLARASNHLRSSNCDNLGKRGARQRKRVGRWSQRSGARAQGAVDKHAAHD